MVSGPNRWIDGGSRQKNFCYCKPRQFLVYYYLPSRTAADFPRRDCAQ